MGIAATPSELSQADSDAIAEYSSEFLDAARYGEKGDLELMFSHPRLRELIDFANLVDCESGTSPLMYASANGFLDCVEYLVEVVGVDINKANVSGNTALHWAALNGNPNVVEYLVSRGVNVMAKNAYGKSPFDEAFARDQKECCEIIAREECRVIREMPDEDMADMESTEMDGILRVSEDLDSIQE
jgi:hypothetical protein